MPPVIVAVGSIAAGSLASGAVSGLVGGGLAGALLGGLAGAAVTVGVSYLGHQMIGTTAPDRPDLPALSGEMLRARTQMILQPVTTRKAVYGRARIGGPLVFWHTRQSDGAPRKDILHLVVAHAAHRVDGFEALYLGDQEVVLDGAGAAVNPPWVVDGVPYVHAWHHDGSDDQAADAVLMAEAGGRWSEDHRLRGIAYTHLRLRLDPGQSLFQGGIPNVSVVLRGRRVHDPRGDTTGWSDNAALCLLDLLRADWGLRAPWEEIDIASWSAAANICDEAVATLDGSEPRYSCGGVVDLGQRRIDTLAAMLSSCAGHLVWTGGQWRLLPGAWRPAEIVLDERHLRAPVTVRPFRSVRALANTARGSFASPAHLWQPTDYPPVAVAPYRAADGEEVPLHLDLPFTPSPTMAQRIGRIAIEQLRHQLGVDLPCNLAGLRVAAGDTVSLSLPRPSLSAVPMTVRSWRLAEDGGVDLTLQRDAPDIYAHDPNLLEELAA